MKCPVCKNITLLMTEKSGVEIDYCPECRGIWLDRGELEKLIGAEKIYNDDGESFKNKNNSNHHDYPQKRKESFFERLDFFD